MAVERNHGDLIRRTLEAVLGGGACGVPKEDISELLKGWAIGKTLVGKRTDKDTAVSESFTATHKAMKSL